MFLFSTYSWRGNIFCWDGLRNVLCVCSSNTKKTILNWEASGIWSEEYVIIGLRSDCQSSCSSLDKGVWGYCPCHSSLLATAIQLEQKVAWTENVKPLDIRHTIQGASSSQSTTTSSDDHTSYLESVKPLDLPFKVLVQLQTTVPSLQVTTVQGYNNAFNCVEWHLQRTIHVRYNLVCLQNVHVQP